MGSSETTIFAAIVGGVGLAIALAAAIWRINRDIRRHRAAVQALRERELAVIDEKIRFTGIGIVSVILLIVVLFGTVAAYSRATTVFQQIEAGVGFIGSTIILGLGAALGRRRTYTVYRSEQREPYG